MSGDIQLAPAVELIEKSGMLNGVKKVLCAVSGGADSMCLLHFMLDYAAKKGISVCAAHYNHMLRGAESDRDEEFVRAWCNEHGIGFIRGSGDVKAFAGENGLSVEEAARSLRYSFLEKAADDLGADVIATAHNSDDLLETMIMNLCRGSGTKGLAGIPPQRGRLIRPLLSVGRDEIISYLDAFSVPHVEDSTNSEDIATRNAIRHNVIPALKAIYPYASKNAYKAAGFARSDDDYLTGIAMSELDRVERTDESVVFNADELMSLPVSISSRMLIEASKKLGITLNSLHIDLIMKLATNGCPSAELSMPGGLTARRRYGELILTSGNNAHLTFEPFELTENEWLTAENAGYSFCLLSGEDNSKINDEFNIFCFKKSAVCGKMQVRPRKIGDRIKTSRRGAEKTLKKIFIEKKIPAAERDRIFVIADEAGVLFAGDIGMDVRAQCGDGDEAISVAIRKDK